MTVPHRLSYDTRRGRISYCPRDLRVDKQAPATLPIPPFCPRRSRPNLVQITRFPVGFDPSHLQPAATRRRFSQDLSEAANLATRDGAKRLFGLVLSPFASSPTTSSVGQPISPRNPDSSGEPANPTPRPPYRTPSNTTPTATPNSDDTMAAAQVARTLHNLPGSRSNLHMVSTPTGRNSISGPSPKPVEATQIDTGDKPVASTNGVSCSIILAEPHVYLTGFDHTTHTHNQQNGTAMIRGKLVLNVTKSAKIKAVTLSFSGKARTEWPEGIPPEKVKFFEEERLRYQVLPFYNALYTDSDEGYGAQCIYTLRNECASSSTTNVSMVGLDQPNTPSTRSSRSSTMLTTRDQKRLSLQTVQSRSFQKSDSQFGATAQQKGYKVFHPGVYEYSFEIALDHTSPETIDLPLGSVKWTLEALVERAGTFKSNLHGSKEVLVVRAPDQNSLEQVEPIAISRQWEDQLHYEIVISGKSFAIGSRIPIAFKLTPLAKVQCHRIKVYITENIEYFCKEKRVTRKDAQRKILLLEKQAGKPISRDYDSSDIRILSGGELNAEQRERARLLAQRRREQAANRSHTSAEPLPPVAENLLGDLDLGLEHLVSQTEIEMEVQLPTCDVIRKEKSSSLAPDTTWKNIQVHHWIKIVLRLSRIDPLDPTGTKRRHFEISIDSPFHILSCLATQAHTSLPEYSGLSTPLPSRTFACGCPNAATTSLTSHSSSSGSIPTLNSFTDQPPGIDAPAAVELAPPAQAHLSSHANVVRPVHMLRNPSFNPPAFDAEEPPPPLATPPPNYDHVFGTPSQNGLADYFARLADAYSDDEHTSEDDDDLELNRSTSRTGRVNVANPRTPGVAGVGRVVSRSMEIDRQFMFRPEVLGRLNDARVGGGVRRTDS